MGQWSSEPWSRVRLWEGNFAQALPNVSGHLLTTVVIFFFAYTQVRTAAQNLGFSCAISFCLNIYYGTLYVGGIETAWLTSGLMSFRLTLLRFYQVHTVRRETGYRWVSHPDTISCNCPFLSDFCIQHSIQQSHGHHQCGRWSRGRHEYSCTDLHLCCVRGLKFFVPREVELTGSRLYVVMAIVAALFPFEPYGRRAA